MGWHNSGNSESELIAVDCKHVERGAGDWSSLLLGARPTRRRGRRIDIQCRRGPLCPILAFERWLAVAGIAQGPIFRPVARGGAGAPVGSLPKPSPSLREAVQPLPSLRRPLR